jgi:dTDP-4-dehydrorhamnose 3,5-epimerase-like enzyme
MTLTNREFSALVDKGTFPEQVAVPIDAPFVNANGEIHNLLLERFTSVALIRSNPGAIRANHFHKTDWHYSYVQSGEVWYYWRPVGSKERPRHQVFPAGTMFFTPPLVEHAMFFPVDTTFLTFAKNIRDTAHHEEDVVRIPIIAAARDEKAPGGWRVSFPDAP